MRDKAGRVFCCGCTRMFEASSQCVLRLSCRLECLQCCVCGGENASEYLNIEPEHGHGSAQRVIGGHGHVIAVSQIGVV